MRITDTHVYFYGKTVFSNWHTSQNQIVDKTTGFSFDSSEQAFMFLKAKFFNDEDSASKILGATNPKTAKELGRGVKNYNDREWSQVRYSFMKLVVYTKFAQNTEFLKELLDTGDRIIVEASPYDRIWGVGLHHTDDLILDEKNWLGENLLGKVLMEVRKML